jgi:response regulator RpfG family c-di-GMP phosphodiesterase
MDPLINSESSILKILIVEDNDALLEILSMLINHHFETQVETIHSPTAKLANTILATQKIDYCFCDHQLFDDLGSDVLNFIISNKLKTKFILCSSFTPEMFPLNYPKDKIFFNIQKPDISEGLEQLFLKINQANSSNKEKSQHNDYVPLSLNLLISLGKMPSDVYLLKDNTVFEKIYSKGENIDPKAWDKFETVYLNKLFAKRHDHNDGMINELDKAINQILASENIPIDRKILATHSQLKELVEIIGITPTMAEMTKAIISEVLAKIITEPIILKFLSNCQLNENYALRLYTLHSILISIIAKKTELDSHQNIYRLVYAAFVQDISIIDPRFQVIIDLKDFLEKQNEFSADEQFQYLNHPTKSQLILSQLEDALYGVDRIIEEQHEMPNKVGFPNQINEIEISPMGALFNLTGIWSRFILKNEKSFHPQDFLDYMESNNFHHGRYMDAYNGIKSILLTQV